MSERCVIASGSLPRLAPHMRLRFDKARAVWAIQAPERTFMLDEIAHAIVSRCDGILSVQAIVGNLCAAFPAAPPEAIETDVVTLLQGFADKGVIRT